MVGKLEKTAEIFSRLQKQNPNPKSELNYTNLYTFLVAVVLSAQATDKSVNKATKSLFKKVKTPKAMLALGEDGLKQYISSIGLYNAKAKNIIKLSEQLVALHKGKVPETFEELINLAGVGQKTANVILNAAFGKSTIAVDTHVFRLSNRLGIAKGKTPEEVEKKLMKVVPEKFLRHAHHWLILHGRYVCKSRNPLCSSCIINDLCEYKEKV